MTPTYLQVKRRVQLAIHDKGTADAAVPLLEGKAHAPAEGSYAHLVSCMNSYPGQSGHTRSIPGFNSNMNTMK